MVCNKLNKTSNSITLGILDYKDLISDVQKQKETRLSSILSQPINVIVDAVIHFDIVFVVVFIVVVV